MDLSQAAGLSSHQSLTNRSVVVVGTIGNPVPTSLTDQVMVLPEDSPANAMGPMDWVKSQGSTLPKYGDRAVVVFDENYTPYMVWFDSQLTYHFSPQDAPAAPASGFLLYTDQSDGKLKAIASSGTITTLATP